MKKVLFAILLSMITLHAFSERPVFYWGDLVQLQVQIYDPVISGNSMPKSPVEPPMVSLDDHTLYLYDVAYDFTLMLVDENDDVVYSTFVPANTASLVLPSTLTGTYTLMLIPNGTYYFEGEIEL